MMRVQGNSVFEGRAKATRCMGSDVGAWRALRSSLNCCDNISCDGKGGRPA